ncbi:hypothetical protein AB0952_22120 [Streptomyces caniferus]
MRATVWTPVVERVVLADAAAVVAGVGALHLQLGGDAELERQRES